MKTTHLLMALLAIAVLASCESKPGETLQQNIDTGNVSTFDPSNGIIPFPNDLLFQGTLDGTLNIPVADPADLSDPQVALNALDGFSTNAPFSAGFAEAIDPVSVTPASVRVFEVNLSSTPGGAVVAPLKSELTFGVDFFATVSSIDASTLVIHPLKPLKPIASYQVVITNALKSAKGNPMLASTTYALAKSTTPYYALPSGPREPNLPAGFDSFTDARLASLEGLRQLISTGENTLANNATPALTTGEIILSWSFTTQSAGNVLSTVRGIAGTPATTVTAFTGDLFGTGAGRTPLGAANIHVGTIGVPYYLQVSTSANDPTALGSVWRAANPAFSGDTEKNLTQYNPLPAATNPALSIPILITTPADTATFPAPWKTVIFQHGITSDRTSMLAIADALAAAGFAVVAIDLPMHGVGSTSPFYSPGNERTFDLDLVTQDAITGSVTAAAPDGVTDSSGTHFINLTNLLNTRDNVRQSVADLFAVTAAIGSINVAGGTNLDAANVYFVGHSLGAIVGTPFLALETGVKDAVLAMGGSAVAKILDGSAAFGPVISAGLAANGVVKGTADYESFLGAAQTVVDSADPVNYSLNAAGYSASAAAGRGLLFFEIVGDSVLGNPSDLVVPNVVPDLTYDVSGTISAPLAGTEPQLTLLGLSQANTTTAPGGKLLVTTKYIAGAHSSLLDPAPNSAVTTEMQKETANFLGSGGTALVVTDGSVLQAP